jgi:hypothetical protein
MYNRATAESLTAAYGAIGMAATRREGDWRVHSTQSLAEGWNATVLALINWWASRG